MTAKLTEAELMTLRILLTNVQQATNAASKTQAAYLDYESKIKTLYGLKDKDGVNLETGVIMRVPDQTT